MFFVALLILKALLTPAVLTCLFWLGVYLMPSCVMLPYLARNTYGPGWGRFCLNCLLALAVCVAFTFFVSEVRKAVVERAAAGRPLFHALLG